MPRARANPEEAGAKKRTATKRARSTSSTSVRRTAKKTTTTPTPTESTKAPVTNVRKAPTGIATERAHERSHNIALIGVMFVSGILVVTGVVIGVSSGGQIDVAAVIAEENERISRGEVLDPQTGQPVTRTIPVQNTAVQSSGGLRPSTRPTTTPATTPPSAGEESVADMTATTTATSSQAQSEEDSEQSEVTEAVDSDTATTSEEGETPSE